MKELKDIKSKEAENHFEEFCTKKGIQFSKVDNKKNMELRGELLIDPSPKGKAPDYFCTKDNKSIFVEVKTLIHLTNKARTDKLLDEKSLEISEILSPKEELRTPLKTKLEKSVKKFNNVKSQTIPRVLLLSGFFSTPKWFAEAIFLGAHPSYKKVDDKLVDAGLLKSDVGLFDLIGSNVSAIVYWDDEMMFHGGVGNSNPLIPLSTEDFFHFFRT